MPSNDVDTNVNSEEARRRGEIMNTLLENQEQNARDFDLDDKLIPSRYFEGEIFQPKKFSEKDMMSQWILEGKRQVTEIITQNHMVKFNFSSF